MRAGLIKILAEKRGITMIRLAASLEISEQQIHRIVKSGSTKVETLEKIAQILGVSASVFFDTDYNPNIISEPKTEHKSSRRASIRFELDSTDVLKIDLKEKCLEIFKKQ